jgi:type I restriction-modification system DNA methylase subunit
MHRMSQSAENDAERDHIKKNQIYGIKAKNDMFAVATTNMILRSDGQSDLICGDFLEQNSADLQLWGNEITVGFMNPPYSQEKDKGTAHLSELRFIRQLLNNVTKNGSVTVVVLVSATIGKTREGKRSPTCEDETPTN